MLRICDNLFHLHDSRILIHDLTFNMYTFSHHYVGKQDTVLHYSSRFNHAVSSDYGIPSTIHPFARKDFLTTAVSEYCVGQESLVRV